MSNRLILWIIILIAGVGLIISANIFRDKTSSGISRQTPTPFETISILPSPFPSPRPSIPPAQAATCQLRGEIRFINQNLYETKDAKITYQNVDDPTRQIFWKSEPNDGVLVIGPNLFEDLSLPSGEREIGVSLKNNPTSKSYTLTAAITYGFKNSNGDTEVKTTNCTGTITVKMP